MAEKWRRLPMPNICERMLGFSVPQDNTVLVVSYEGTHLVRLGPPAAVETDSEYAEYDLYDPDSGECHYHGRTWDIIGLFPGRPLLEGRDGERLVLDAAAFTVSVVVSDETVWSSGFENFSGDWVAATFSPGGRFIVLGCPYDFDFRVWERVEDVYPRRIGVREAGPAVDVQEARRGSAPSHCGKRSASVFPREGSEADDRAGEGDDREAEPCMSPRCGRPRPPRAVSGNITVPFGGRGR